MVGELIFDVAGEKYAIEVLNKGMGRWCALTRFSETDIIISDGRSPKDALERHRFVLPIAVDCRLQRLTLAKTKADGVGPRLRK